MVGGYKKWFVTHSQKRSNGQTENWPKCNCLKKEHIEVPARAPMKNFLSFFREYENEQY